MRERIEKWQERERLRKRASNRTSERESAELPSVEATETTTWQKCEAVSRRARIQGS